MIIIFLIVVLFLNICKADQSMLADSHGPISVMGDHMHKKGEVMFSYRFSNMGMDKVFNGRKKLTINEITTTPNSASNGSGTYMNAPVSMDMKMHMFGIMYAPLDDLTLMIMTSYLEKQMIQQRMGMSGSGQFTVNSSGIGDTRLSGMINLHHLKNMKTHLGLGLSLPSGSLNNRDKTPISNNTRLGYAMQNGSGTVDPFLFVNNVSDFNKLKIGQQVYFKFPANGKNSKGYQYGNNFNSKLWFSYRWLDNLSSSLKITYDSLSNMSGEDNEFNFRMSPAMDSKNSGHQRVDLAFGLNFINTNEFLKNYRLGIELDLPLFQRLNGIQMGKSYGIMIGWQKMF